MSPHCPLCHHARPAGLGRLLVFLFGVLLLTAGQPAAAQTPPDQTDRRPFVLVLHSYKPSLWDDGLQAGINRQLLGPARIDLYVDYMDARKIASPEYLAELQRLFALKYREIRFDLVIVCDDHAYQFALLQHRTMWPGVPVVFCGVGTLRPEEFAGHENFTGISENNDLTTVVAALPRLLPDLHTLYVIRDEATFSRDIQPHLLAALAAAAPKLKIQYLENLPAKELASRLERLPADSAVFFLSFWRDSDGRFINGEENQRILKHSAVPVFTAHESLVGNGALAASFVDAGDHGEAAGAIALRILRGTPAADIPATVGPPRRLVFDYPSLERFGIPRSALPPGSHLINEPFSFYRTYRALVWATLSLIAVLSALVIGLILLIAQRRRAAAQLSASEQKFHAIFDQTFQLTGLLDTTGRLLAVNPTALHLVGHTEAAVLGRCFWETPWWAHDPAAQQRVQDSVARAAAGETVRFETHHRTPSGELRTIDFSIKPVRATDGRVLSLLPEGRDITDIRRTEARLQAVLASAPLILWAVDATGRFNLSIGSGLGLIDQQPDALLGTDVFTFSGDTSDLAAAFRQALRGETARTLAPLGSRWFELHVAPLLTPDGTVRGATGIALDVTERILAEANRAQLATAVEQSADEIILTDAQGLIQYVNPAFERVTGYSRAEAVGRNPRLLRSGRHDDAFYQQLWQTILSGEVWTGRFQNRRKNGTLFLEDATITPLLDERRAVQGFVSVRRDVTRQVQLEEELRQVQRTEAIGKLAGGVAHDFNNILQIIQSSVAMARDDAPSPELTEWLNQIEQATNRAAGLTRQLLAFSRKQRLQFKLLDPAIALTDVLKLIRRVIGEHIQVEYRASAGLDLIRADVGQFEQIVLNLCVNARDAMAHGGRLSLTLQNRQLAAPDLPPDSALQPGRFLCLSVRDTGHGMSAETRDRIFEPFFTTKPVGQGTGLGLSVVHGIVQQHSGFIRVESTIGVGTAFDVFLPAVPADHTEPDEATPAPTAQETPNGHGETILLAEDDPQVRDSVCKILSRHGYRLLVAADGEEACALADGHLDEIALALFDVVMPRLGGIDAAWRLRRLKPSLPIVLCSGYASGFSPDNLPDPTWYLVQKPYQAKVLLQTLNTALASRG